MNQSDSAGRVGVLATPFSHACSVLLVLIAGLAGSAAGEPTGNLRLVKTGSLVMGSDGVATPGDVIEYTITAENTSSEDCSILWHLWGQDTLLGILCWDSEDVLWINDRYECHRSYRITQNDIDAGSVYNRAEFGGVLSGLCDTPADSSATADHTQVIPQALSISLTKTGALDLGSDGVANPGDVISYELAVSNSGNVTLSSVQVTDPWLASFSCGDPIPVLAPGASTACTGTYTITQADVDAGFKDNTAEVTADGPTPAPGAPAARQPVTGQGFLRVMIPQVPRIEIAKTGKPDLGIDGFADPGDLVDYVLQVKNAGNVTLTDVGVSDPLVPQIACPSGNPIPELTPGQSESCAASHAITETDISAGSVLNTAAVSGTDPAMQVVAAGDSDTVALPSPVATSGPLAITILALMLAGAAGLALRQRRLR